jgi:NADH dehydrogenase FAD-containing subunit
VVFVGGGHAHLYSLRRAKEFRRRGAEVVLVAPHRYHYYSGMGPGLLSGRYRPDEARVDLSALAIEGGFAFRMERVVSVDAGARQLGLEGGQTLPYDLVSFNTGSRVPEEWIPGAAAEATAVKPVENLERLRERLLRKGAGGPARVLVVGGGPAGVEVAGNLWLLGRDGGAPLEIAVWEAAERLLPRLPARAGALALRSLRVRGIVVRTGVGLERLEGGTAQATSGEVLPYDVAVLTVGIVPDDLYRLSGLPTGPDGGLLVDAFLRCPRYPEVFGGGDCVHFARRPLHRVGVYAVRQAPVLFRNLLAALQGTPLEPFRPQRRYLLILNLGDGNGLAVWGGLTAHGRWALRWKDRLDRTFLAQFQGGGEAAGT